MADARQQPGALGSCARAHCRRARRIARRLHVAGRQADEARDRRPSRAFGLARRMGRVCRRDGLHRAHDHSRGHGDRALDGDAALSSEAGRRPGRRGRRDGCGRVRRVALVALRTARQPRAVLPGHRGLPRRLRRAARDLRFPRAHGSERRHSERATAPRSHGALRPGWPLRPLVDVLAGGVADGLAAGLEPVAAASAGVRALTRVRPFRRGRRAPRAEDGLRLPLRR